MARATDIDTATAGWTWTAVITGVIASLVVQVILVMLGIAAGLIAIGSASSTATPAWLAFAWWAFSGIFAAAVGGWVAGTLSPTESPRLKAIAGVSSWAIATLVVVGVSGVTAGTTASAVSTMAGPSVAAVYRMQASQAGPRETTGQASQAAPSQETLDEGRRTLSYLMLLSAVALILGGLAAYAAAYNSLDRRDLERAT